MSDRNPSFRIRKAVRYRIVDREAVVVRQDSGEVMVLNEVGARVLALLAEGLSPSEIARRIPEEFEVTPEQADEDVKLYLDELMVAGLIERAP